MKEYEDLKYDQWRDTTEEALPVLLKKTLLARVHACGVVIQCNPESPDQVMIKPSPSQAFASPWEHTHVVEQF